MLQRFSLVAFIGLLLLTACRTDDPFSELVPPDEDPVIAVISPTNTRFLNRPGDQITVTFQLADQEGIRLFRAVPRLYSANDELLGDLLPIDFDVSGQNENFDFNLTILPANPFEKYEYVCYVIDTKGASAKANFWVSILPDPADPEPFEILTYENDSIKNPGIADSTEYLYAFNLSARRPIPSIPNQDLDTLLLQMDIAVDSDVPLGLPWEPYLSSPNNADAGQDSVFVITSAERFNYEEATYTTIFQAFFSDPLPQAKTPVLEPGQIVIVRLIKTPRPQFAVMRITRIEDDGAGLLGQNDRLFFDYKVTTP